MKQILEEINGEVSLFSQLEEQLFRQRLGQKPNYFVIHRAIASIQEELDDISNRILESNDFNKDSKKTALAYIMKLVKAVNYLADISINLENKSKGGKYGILKYRKDVKNYNIACKEYQDIAPAVQSLYDSQLE